MPRKNSMPPNEKRTESEVTCEGVLNVLIELARAVLGDAAGSTATASPVAGSPVAGGPVAGSPATASPAASAAQQRLLQALLGLQPEMAIKVRTLMVAGRDSQDISSVRTNMTPGDAESAFAAAARDVSENGPLLAEYLRRGHALACAMGLDLEKPVSGWGALAPQTLDERAWLSFGKQLASAPPDEWQCMAFSEPSGSTIARIYLKLPDHAWWSFQALLDRPSPAIVTKEKRAMGSKASKRVSSLTLKALAARLSDAPASDARGAARRAEPTRAVAQGRALRRAARAIRARVGRASEAP